jgi:hypothetical protein
MLELLPLLHRHGIQLWLPEVGGPIDADDPTHRALITLLGHQSRREVLRSRFRTTAAMRAQVLHQGRHQGGRPPYGYRLVDAGPHPNKAHAAWGRRLHRLDPDPDTNAVAAYYAPPQPYWHATRPRSSSIAGMISSHSSETTGKGSKPKRETHWCGLTCPRTELTLNYMIVIHQELQLS